MKCWTICGLAVLCFSGCASSAGVGSGDTAGSLELDGAVGGADTSSTTLDGAVGTDQQGGTKPGAPSVTILTPEEGAVFGIGEEVDLTATVGDPDGGLEGLSYVWESDLDGQLMSGQVGGPTLTASVDDLSAGDHLVSLTVTDLDGLEGVDSVALFVNRPPTGITLVAIAPSSPVTTDSLTATITQAATDPDGDLVTYAFTWFVDEVPAGISGETVPAQETVRGQVWRVAALPTDAHTTGEAGQASVTIGNTVPSIDAVTVLPSAG
ncbi:MAG: Ig-like domain-containing protein, partial [Myxococcota bacterium]|nr:Ig-like domain-containing protein [Myxococcota bacterium]